MLLAHTLIQHGFGTACHCYRSRYCGNYYYYGHGWVDWLCHMQRQIAGRENGKRRDKSRNWIMKGMFSALIAGCAVAFMSNGRVTLQPHRKPDLLIFCIPGSI